MSRRRRSAEVSLVLVQTRGYSSSAGVEIITGVHGGWNVPLSLYTSVYSSLSHYPITGQPTLQTGQTIIDNDASQ